MRGWGHSNEQRRGEPLGGGAATNWSPERSPATTSTAADGGGEDGVDADDSRAPQLDSFDGEDRGRGGGAPGHLGEARGGLDRRRIGGDGGGRARVSWRAREERERARERRGRG